MKNCFRIVVVGGVGVGKTSLLERLVEVKLPKGIDSFTRRPLIINYNSLKTADVNVIDEATMKVITKEPVVVNLLSSNRVHFEFIDLPGLTSMSRPDQPENYPQFTRELLELYTATADVILLCLPVDADLVNSDALKFVKSLEIDNRVICCLTKFDLLSDSSTEVQLESTRTFSGVISLRNAPLLEMSESIRSTNQKEIEFFSLDKKNCGIEAVKNGILKIVKNDFNQMRNEISSRLWREKIRLEKRVKAMKDPNFSLKLVTDYIEFVTNEITGNCKCENEQISGVSCGTRIGLIFWKNLPEALETIDILKGINLEHMKILIKNSQGLKSSFQFENAFKILLKSQLKASETIIFDCLNLISRELKDLLLIFIEESDEEEEEFYDVNSLSDTEITELPDMITVSLSDANEDILIDSNNIKSQLKLIPSLTKMINKTVSRVLEESQEKTRKYLRDYCEMQKEMVFCNEPEYIEAFRRYYSCSGDSEVVKGGDSNSRSRNNTSNSRSRNNTNGSRNANITRNNSNNSNLDLSISDDLPLKSIQSESLETLSKQQEESSGFLKEFLALLFPNVQDIKRVEYRPRKRQLNKKETETGNDNEIVNLENEIVNMLSGVTSSKVLADNRSPVSRDEEFILNLLEIYLKSYHRQLTDFIPKCINYHLIRETLKQLPLQLLNNCNMRGDEGGNWREEIKRIEIVLKMIEEIND